MLGFDKVRTNQLLFSTPFREGVGTLTRDVAKTRNRGLTLVGAPDWVSIASGLPVLDFDGAADYAELAGASCADLNFTSEDYSLTCWLYRENPVSSDMLMARYELDVSGWETYFYTNGAHEYLTLRHHHATEASPRTGCYSDDWAIDQWWFLGITRSGLYPRHYRNGQEVEVTYDAGGLLDPDTCARDLVLSTRYTKDTDWFNGKIWDPRIWLGELTAIQMRTLFNMDRHWFLS